MRSKLFVIFLVLPVLFVLHVIFFTPLFTGLDIVWYSLGSMFLLLVAFLLEKRFGTIFTSWVYRCIVGWFQTIVLAAFLLSIAFFLDWLFVFPQGFLIAYILTGVGVVYGFIQAQRVIITEISLSHPKIKKPLKIGQLTDVHAFGARAKKWLSQMAEKLYEYNPDVVVLTGDILDYPSPLSPEVFTSLDKSIPHYYVLGNHEFYLGEQIAASQASLSHVQLLRGDTRDHGSIRFIGFDDSERKRQVFENLPLYLDKEKYNVLLYHRPVGVEDAALLGADLFLAGHTHAGQFFPMDLIVKQLFGSFYHGFHRIRSMFLYTSAGSGTRNWPLRIGHPQEIVLIALLPEEK